MPLGRGIAEVFGAIPDRIEVSGHGPTWRVTGGSFESALGYAREAYGDPVVVAREDRNRWWPRVTLTVTRDPALARDAPPIQTFARPAQSPRPDPATAPEPPAARPSTSAPGPSSLEEIFAHQEELRAARGRIPEQRPGHGRPPSAD